MSDKIYVVNGCSNHSEFDRANNDFYATNPKDVEKLFSECNIQFAQNILEPCAGEGHIAQVFKDKGYNVTASGIYSHAEGSGTTASGEDSHAEGSGTTASGTMSHAEGGGTKASGSWSHAEGGSTVAGKGRSRRRPSARTSGRGDRGAHAGRGRRVRRAF